MTLLKNAFAKLLGLFLFIFMQSVTIAQSANDALSITLDRSITVNDHHPYMDIFETKDAEYITWLYSLNKTNAINTPEYYNPAVLLANSAGNNSLIFTLTSGSEIRFDTVRNTLHPDNSEQGWDFLGIRKALAKSRAKHKLKEQNLQGDLPKGCMTWLSAKRNGLACGVEVAEVESQVKIEIATLEGEVIATVVDDNLPRGWNNFKWIRGRYGRGVYSLRISIDGHLMTQNFKI